MRNALLRNTNEVAAATTFSNEWDGTYGNLYNIKVIKDKCNGTLNNGQIALLGMTQTLEAINWGTLTDMHGNIPCSEALGSVSAPKLDSQKDIYSKIITLLDSAQTNFANSTSSTNKVGTHDVIFGGDVKKWSGLAHALKARYLLHTYGTDKTTAHLNEVLTIAQGRDEQLETYNDIRRCRYIDGSYPVAMTNPNNTSGSSNRWPLRLPYGNSDVTSNPNVAAAFGTGSNAGLYIYTDPVWWAGGKE